MLEENRALQEQIGIHAPELMHPQLGLGWFTFPLGIRVEDEVNVPSGCAMRNFHDFAICGAGHISRITFELNARVADKFRRLGAIFLQRHRVLGI